MELEGKIALVTGAGQGVGQGIALALAAKGAKVAVTGRTLAKLEATCEKISARGGQALAIVCDVKDADAMAACVDKTVSEFGGINILVNNAQEVPLGTLQQVTDDSFTAGWESGPLATFRLMKLCYPHLKGDGCIINLASSAGKRWDMSGYGCYAATKEAIRSLTRAAACEWGPDNIRVNCIAPGTVKTDFARVLWENPETHARAVARYPIGRLGEPEDVAGAAVFLAARAGQWVTGQVINVDGGCTIAGGG